MPPPDDEPTAPTSKYDSFLREAAHVTDRAAMTAARPLAIGTRLAAGRFELIEILGQGGMGVVYAARDHARGGEVALKTLHVNTLAAIERMRGEFLVLHDLVHRNLVVLGELVDDGGRWLFTMERVRGPDFLSYVRPGGVLDVARLRAAAAQLATGLGFLHAAGNVHRDVKPSNVLVDGDRVVLLDFGLAATSGGVAAGGGTLAYMAPEQGLGAVGPAADWYAFGVMLWEALTGALPFGGTGDEVAAAKQRGGPALAIDTAADLAQLAGALLDPDPARRPDGAAVAAVLGAAMREQPAASRFVGRARERAMLDAACAAAGAASRSLLVRGPSGIGKSALVAAFADDARGRGALVLAGRCYERVAVPYKGLHEVAAALAVALATDPAARAVALDGADLGLLPAALPALVALAEIDRARRVAPTVRDPAERRDRVFDALAGVLGRLAARAPLVIAIDDVQWADRDGLALLAHVVAQVPRGVLVVATAADGAAVDPAWAEGAEVFELGPLARGDAVALGVALLGGDDAAAGALVEEAGGHPLHLAELAVHRRSGRGQGQITGVRLEDAIAARVAELPAAAARLLAVVALAGAPLPQDVLATAAELDGAAWWVGLGALRAAHLVKSAGASPGDPVEPYHDRVRATVVAELASAARRAVHARLAAVLEHHALASARPELVADHLEAGGELARAIDYVEAAAAQAANALAFERAGELYRRALRLDQGAVPARRAALHEALGQVCADGGHGGEAAEAFAAAAAARGGGDASLDLHRRSAEQLLRSGRIDDGIERMDQVLAALGLPVLGARRWPVVGLVGARARLALRRWRKPATGTPTLRDQLRLAACWSAVVGSSLVSPLRGAEFQARHLRLALEAGDVRRIALGLAFEGGAAAVVGPPATRAHALLAEAAQWAERADEPLVRAYLDLAHGSVAFLTLQWRESLIRCDAAERRLRDECVGAAWEIGTAQRISLTALWHMGRIRELRARTAAALAEAARRHDLYAAIQMKTVLTPVLCLMDDRVDDAAVEVAEAAAGLPRRGVTLQHWQLMQARALVAIYRGEPAAAAELIARETPALRRGFLFRVHAVRVFTAYVEAAAALGAAVAGGPSASRHRAHARALGRRLARSGGSVEAAALLAAELHVLDGDLDRACTRYRAAIDGFVAGDMALLAHAARWRLGELLGGDEGTALVAAAGAALRAEGIRDPARTVAVFVPVASKGR